MFNESIPVESKGHIYSSDISLSKDQYILVANDAGQVLAAIKMPLDPLTSNRKSGAVCAYNSEVKNYKFYVGNSFNGAMDYFDGRFGMYTPAQNFSINGFANTKCGKWHTCCKTWDKAMLSAFSTSTLYLFLYHFRSPSRYIKYTSFDFSHECNLSTKFFNKAW